MITNTGQSIIGKYLLGQAPAYASYIAVGCGAQPLATADPYGNYSTKENLDFEMFRVPISSRGFVNDGGTEKLVLTAELPTEERYEITEIGIYSAGSNPSAGAYDSKTVFAFSTGEGWQYHDQTSATSIPTITEPLDDPNDDNIIATTDPVFQTNADNSIFFKSSRADRYERCRFLNNMIMVVGDDADLTIDPSTGSAGGHFYIEPGSNHIHLTGADVDFSKNAPTDQLRLAFSLISKDGDSASVPDTVRILIEFASTDAENAGEYARMEIELDNGSGTGGTYDFAENRYYVITEQLQNLYVTNGFTWDAVTVVKIYTSIQNSDTPTGDYYIAYDALRLENVSTINPLYGLTGYSVVKNADATTIIKNPNTSNYIEFRFTVGVS
jgi:hypothetical protein